MIKAHRHRRERRSLAQTLRNYGRQLFLISRRDSARSRWPLVSGYFPPITGSDHWLRERFGERGLRRIPGDEIARAN